MIKPGWSVGLMTGTVLDGEIDVALLRTNGEEILEFGSVATCHYPETVRDEIRLAIDDASAWNFNGRKPASFERAARSLTIAQADAVNHTLSQAGLDAEQVSSVGFHGQTVLHRPPAHPGCVDAVVGTNANAQSLSAKGAITESPRKQDCSSTGPIRHGKTLQLGDGALLAELTKATVVSEFRQMDMAHGGQGAPLVPVYHQALLKQSNLVDDPPALVNLGGIGNITWWDGRDNLVAFDTGPANAPINDWVSQCGAGAFDCDGVLASRGSVNEKKLQRVLDHSFFTAAFPKSLDRQDFSGVLDDATQGMSVEDGAAFLVAVCAGAIALALTLLPTKPTQLVLCGGGRLNHTLLAEIRHRTGCDVVEAETYGWRGDSMEAECFAFLAERVLRHLPTSFPNTTGCERPVCGGTVSRRMSVF